MVKRYFRLASVKSKLGIDQLARREQMALLIGGIFIVMVVLYQITLSPYLESRSKLQSSILSKTGELIEIKQLSQEYADLRAEEGGIKANLVKREPGFTLFAFLDQQAQKAAVKQQIKYMKPSEVAGDGDLKESVVEMKLEGVSLGSLTDFLHLTESSENVVSIRRLSIQTSARDEGTLDVILQIVTLVEAG